jgi:hypothetical protein
LVTDTPANIQTYAAELGTLDKPLAVTLSASGQVNATTLALLAASTLTKAGYTLTLTGNVASVTGLSAAVLGHADAVAVTDSAADLTDAAFNALQADVHVGLSITVSGVSHNVTIVDSTYAADTAEVDALQSPASLTVTGAAADLALQAAALGADTHVAAVQLTDSATNIDANIAALTAATGFAAKLAITLTAGGTVTAPTLALLAETSAANPGPYTLDLADNAADVIGLSAQAFALATAISISDSAADITPTVLNDLQASLGQGQTLAITLTGSSPSLAVSSTLYSADTAIIDAITNTGVVTVTGGAAAIGAIATTLNGDARVAGA